MKRIVVTGASGFIGGHVVRQLAARGHRVIATGRNLTALATHAAYAECVPLDLVKDSLNTLTENCDAIIHCAALSSPWGNDQAFYDANVVATERLLDAAQANSVSRFVYLSSPSVYFEFVDKLGVTETDVPKKQVNAYARTKLQAEHAVQRAFANGLQTVTLRPRAVFGEGDAAIMPRILRIARRGFFPLFGGGNAQIDVTYVGNVVHAALLALEADASALGRCFNITNNESTTARQLLETIFKELQWQVRLLLIPRSIALKLATIAEWQAQLRPNNPEPSLTRYGVGVLSYSQTLDIDAAQRYLGYQPVVSLNDGIRRYTEWFLAQADGKHAN